MTLHGIRDVFDLAFLNVKKRQVVISPATYHPYEALVVAQIEFFFKEAKELKFPNGLVQHDSETKFAKNFK